MCCQRKISEMLVLHEQMNTSSHFLRFSSLSERKKTAAQGQPSRAAKSTTDGFLFLMRLIDNCLCVTLCLRCVDLYLCVCNINRGAFGKSAEILRHVKSILVSFWKFCWNLLWITLKLPFIVHLCKVASLKQPGMPQIKKEAFIMCLSLNVGLSAHSETLFLDVCSVKETELLNSCLSLDLFVTRESELYALKLL